MIEKNDLSLFCPIFPTCSGCVCLENIRTPIIWNDVKSFFEKQPNPIEVELVSKEIYNWRCRAKLAVRKGKKEPLIGLFAKDSHTVIDMQKCPLHNIFIDKVLEKIRHFLALYEIEAYDEKSHTGRLRYIQITVQKSSNEVQLCLVFCGSFLKEKEKLFVKQLYNEGIFHSIWVNYHLEKSNTIFGSNWEFLEGKIDFFQEIHGISFAFHPSSFMQAHISLFEDMISYIEKLLKAKTTLIELYAGVGCIGLSVAHKVQKLFCIESSPYTKECFEKTVKDLPEEIRKKCIFIESPVEKTSFPSTENGTILVDPPRKGLSKVCKEKIVQSDAKNLIYVSCGPESFMRDAIDLQSYGWQIRYARGFLLFPGSNHVEIVCFFEKA